MTTQQHPPPTAIHTKNHHQPIKTNPIPCYCVHCSTLNPFGAIIRFSDASVALTRCSICNQYVDPYVELETVLICLDLCLHRMPAYRHVILNRSLDTSYLVRFSLLTLVVDSNATAWVLNSWSPQIYFGTACIGFISSTWIGWLLLKNNQSIPLITITTTTSNTNLIICRALLLSRFPSVILFTIASAWEYSSMFQNLIGLLSFTVLIASLHTFQSLQKSILVASIVSIIRILPFMYIFLFS
jgi:hypothetical protein